MNIIVDFEELDETCCVTDAERDRAIWFDFHATAFRVDMNYNLLFFSCGGEASIYMTWAQNETPRCTKERKSGGRDGDEERSGKMGGKGGVVGEEQNKLKTFMSEMWKCSLVSSSVAPWRVTIKTCNSRYRRVDTWPDFTEYFIRFIVVFVIIVMRFEQIRVYSHAGSVAQGLLAWNLVQSFMVSSWWILLIMIIPWLFFVLFFF